MITTAWHKVSREHELAYQKEIVVLTENLRDCYSDMSPDEICEIIVSALHTAAEKTLPKSKFNKHTKPYWNKDVKNAHTNARAHRRKWLSFGRPRDENNQYYRAYKDAKAAFRRLQRYESDKYMQQTFEELDKAAELDYRLFWKLLRRQSGRKSSYVNKIIVNDVTYNSHEEVIIGFKQYFENVFRNKSFNQDQEKFANTVNSLHKNFEQACHCRRNDLLEKDVTLVEIKEIISVLKKRKAPGPDQIVNEHITYGGEPVAKLLVILFNRILETERTPSSWKKSVITPLYKGGGKPKSDPSSYRPISLMQVLAKVFEKFIRERIYSAFKVFPAAKEFPCKQQHGFYKGS